MEKPDMSHALPRRAVLKTLGLAAAGVVVGSCGLKPRVMTPVSPHLRLVPVRVSPERVIRTVVGLRPFRPSGFVIRTDRFDEKTVVHNYGHGGGGMTLSWGSAQLAMELAMETGQKHAAVVGCGAVGLATARLLQRHGWTATIYARDLPPQTTSNISGAQWSPSSVFDPGQTTVAFNNQFERAMRLSYRAFQDMVGDDYGVRWASNYLLRERPNPPGGLVSRFPELFPETTLLAPGEHPFHTPYALHYKTMFIEPPIYLNAVLRDFYVAGGRVVVREMHNREEMLTLPEPVIVNCTGLGAGELFGDTELTPIKGQLTVLLPQSDVDYLLIHQSYYMFPRRDGVLLGGTYDRDDWLLEPDREAEAEIIAAHQDVFRRMRPKAPGRPQEP